MGAVAGHVRGHPSQTPFERGSGPTLAGPPLLCRLGHFLLLDLLVVVRARWADRDFSRLHGLWHFPHEPDLQQTVVEIRTAHLHVVGKAEGSAERATGDALIEHLL